MTGRPLSQLLVAAAVAEAVALAVLLAVVGVLLAMRRRGARIDPDDLLRIVVAPAIFLMLVAAVSRAWPFAAGAALLVVVGAAGQGWLARRERRREHDTALEIMRRGTIDDGDRNTRRPPGGFDG